MLIPPGDSYEEIYDNFRWDIPEYYNIANDVCDRHADNPDRIALIHENLKGVVTRYSYQQIRNYANQLANGLVDLGLVRGDVVSIFLAQAPETPITHVACWKAGFVSSPISVLFGSDAIIYRVNDTQARVMVTNLANLPKVLEVKNQLPTLQQILVIDGPAEGAEDYWSFLENYSNEFENVITRSEDPAFINYTSGTTGNPKGATQGHRSMLGHMSGIEFMFDFFPQPNDVIWSPADWSWLAGLMDILMPGLYAGIPVVCSDSAKFDPEDAYRLMSEHKVTCALLTPTVLKLMRQVKDATSRYPLSLRCVVSGAEAVGAELIAWAENALNSVVNEGFGQTECNVVLGTNSRVMEARPGSLGKSAPGHIGAIVDDSGRVLEPGNLGNIAFKAPDPVMMLYYHNNPKATEEKYADGWLITGDLGIMDEDGYFWFKGRKDDVITSRGYRIGPSEIEDVLISHPAVAIAAVIGVPDPQLTEKIKAYIILAQGYTQDEDLVAELKQTVRSRLAHHEVPHYFEFVDELPMTATGKIIRRELRDRSVNQCVC
ncbi:MAG: AMP-binding protein [Gammaproteobacteria bacterium]|nr:AMP-binding protein [Gammaproteobacteria bacterium]